MLFEDDGLHIRKIDHEIDDREAHIREFRRDLLQRRAIGEADGDDRRMAIACETGQRLLALGVVLDLEVAIGDAGFLLEGLGAVIGGLVEGFVEFPADIEGDGRLDLCCGWHGQQSRKAAETARRFIVKISLERHRSRDLTLFLELARGAGLSITRS